MSEIIKGRISSYIYKSEDSLYKIARIISNNEEVIITGSFMDLEEGLEYEFVGEHVDHPKYGVQFKIESYTKTNSFTKEGLIAYFSSDKFHGIGTRLATNIVEILGEDCIEQILEDPDCLDVIPKLQPAKKDVIISVLNSSPMYISIGTTKFFFINGCRAFFRFTYPLSFNSGANAFISIEYFAFANAKSSFPIF